MLKIFVAFVFGFALATATIKFLPAASKLVTPETNNTPEVSENTSSNENSTQQDDETTNPQGQELQQTIKEYSPEINPGQSKGVKAIYEVFPSVENVKVMVESYYFESGSFIIDFEGQHVIYSAENNSAYYWDQFTVVPGNTTRLRKITQTEKETNNSITETGTSSFSIDGNQWSTKDFTDKSTTPTLLMPGLPFKGQYTHKASTLSPESLKTFGINSNRLAKGLKVAFGPYIDAIGLKTQGEIKIDNRPVLQYKLVSLKPFTNLSDPSKLEMLNDVTINCKMGPVWKCLNL